MEYIKEYKYFKDNDMNKNNENIEDQKIDYTIKEIKIKKRWETIKEEWKKDVEGFMEDCIKNSIRKRKYKYWWNL